MHSASFSFSLTFSIAGIWLEISLVTVCFYKREAKPYHTCPQRYMLYLWIWNRPHVTLIKDTVHLWNTFKQYGPYTALYLTAGKMPWGLIPQLSATIKPPKSGKLWRMTHQTFSFSCFWEHFCLLTSGRNSVWMAVLPQRPEVLSSPEVLIQLTPDCQCVCHKNIVK